MSAATAAEFQRQTLTKQLTVLDYGVTRRAGRAEFGICDDVTEWSTFDPCASAMRLWINSFASVAAR